MLRGKNTIHVGLGTLVTALAWLSACTSAPIKMECQEIQARMHYSDLSADQQRFAQQELDECLGRVKAADDRDSARLEGVEQRFTPADSQ